LQPIEVYQISDGFTAISQFMNMYIYDLSIFRVLYRHMC
jgi:hypothetical protein